MFELIFYSQISACPTPQESRVSLGPPAMLILGSAPVEELAVIISLFSFVETFQILLVIRSLSIFEYIVMKFLFYFH